MASRAGTDTVQLPLARIAKLVGVDAQLGVVAQTSGNKRGEFDRGRHDETIVVVGVLANKVHATGCAKQTCGSAVHLRIQAAQRRCGMMKRLSLLHFSPPLVPASSNWCAVRKRA